MTGDELQQLVKGADAKKLVIALKPLTEPERKKLAKMAAELLKTARQNERNIWTQIATGVANVAAIAQDTDRIFEPQAIAGIAVLGLCGWTEAKKVAPDRRSFLPNPNIGQVVRDRKPEWIDKWVEKELDSDRGCDWAAIRAMVRDGICPEPKTDRYIFWMLRSAGWSGERAPLIDKILSDRGLLQDEVWRIFIADFRDQVVLVTGEFEHDYRQAWGPALVELAARGELDRARMLTASLDALNRKQHASNASWFFKLHETLKPTMQERIERQGKYADLLVNDVPGVVGFAIDALREIAKSATLETGKIIGGLGAALTIRQKGHATGAARLLKLCAKQKGHATAIAAAAAIGLEHPAVEVQEACVELLEQVGIAGAEELVVARAGSVVASLRARVQALQGEKTAEFQRRQDSIEEEEDLSSAAAELPQRWRELAGVDVAIAALSGGGELTAVTFNPLAVPRLDPATVVVPIAGFDELIERMSSAIEKLESATELELVLDGICRFAQRPTDFDQRTAPLLQRTTTLVGANQFFALHTADPEIKLRALARAWILREELPWLPEGRVTVIDTLTDLGKEPNAKRSINDFLIGRMAEVASLARRGIAAPLLALPTHAGGWIDPRVLVERIESRPANLQILDFVQALLRLAPENRAEALQRAADIPGEAGTALRYALGAEEAIGKNPALWITAARVRKPAGEFPELAKAFCADLGPDGAMPGVLRWEFEKGEHRWESPSQLRIASVPALPRHAIPVDRPTVLRHQHEQAFWAMSSIGAIRSQAAVWPANQETFFAHGAINIASRLNNPASAFSPTAQFLEPLFDSETALGPMAKLALCLAILSKDAGTRGMAIDALISLIEDGRCIGAELGSTLAALHQASDIVRLNRVAGALAEVSRAGVLQQYVAANVLEAFMATLHARSAEIPADLHHLLTPLREWLTALGGGPKPHTRQFLQQAKTGGKTKALIAALLAMKPGQGMPREAAIQSLRARIERARRWTEHAGMAPV